MKVLRMIGIILIVIGMFMVWQCSEMPTAVNDQSVELNDSDDQLTNLSKGRGGGGSKGKRGGGSGDEGGDEGGDESDDGGDDDSDKPPWAGGDPDENPHKKGNDESGTKRGTNFGDLFMVLRYDTGQSDLDSEGRTQPIAFEAEMDANGEPVIDDKGLPVLIYEDGFPVESTEYDALGYTDDGDLWIPYGVGPCSVEFGRINIARAPASVLNQALREAVNTLDNADEIKLDFAGRLTASYNDGSYKIIDSPRENMALYKELMTDGFGDDLAFLSGLGFDRLDLAASSFAGSSDKKYYIVVDEIMYCNTFLGFDGYIYSYYYDRGVYNNRKISHNDGHYSEKSISDCASEGYFSFTWKWGAGPWNKAAAFRTAADDAVQVIEYIHGDSDIVFIW
jgi:hypothetical protein